MGKRLETLDKIAKVQEYLNSNFVEREDIIEGMLTALGARQHVLFIGAPGTAKSALVSALASCINVRYFQICLTKFTVPEEVFGPVDIRALEGGRFERLTESYLPSAEIAFIDEVFKANSAILNSLLTVMNERYYKNGTQVIKCPLISLYGASNEVPTGDSETELAAFADRFLLRYEIRYIAEDGNFAKMLLNEPEDTEKPSLNIKDVELFNKMTESVKVNGVAVDAIITLRRALLNAGITVSDRRWKQSISVLKAKALLSGADEIVPERDFDILTYVLAMPDQRRTVASIIRKTVDPIGEKIMEILEEAQAVYKNAINSGETAVGIETNKKLKMMIAELKTIKDQGTAGTKAKAENAINKIEKYNQEVIKKCLGLNI